MDSQRSSSSTAGPMASGSSRTAASCSGWRNNASVPSPNMFDVVSWPASSSSPAMPTSSSSLNSTPCSRISMPRMSSPGLLRARSTSECMYSRACRCISNRSGIGGGQVELAGSSLLEVAAVAVRDAQQFADHQRRDGQREGLHQVDGRARGLHGVEVLGDDLGDARFEPLHPADGELGGEHSAQALMLGRVESQQVARAGAGLLLLGHRWSARQHESRWARVGEVGVVGKHRLDIVVAGDQVDLHAERVGHRLHPCARPDLGELGDRIERVSAHVHGRRRGSGGHGFDGTDGFGGRHGPERVMEFEDAACRTTQCNSPRQEVLHQPIDQWGILQRGQVRDAVEHDEPRAGDGIGHRLGLGVGEHRVLGARDHQHWCRDVGQQRSLIWAAGYDTAHRPRAGVEVDGLDRASHEVDDVGPTAEVVGPRKALSTERVNGGRMPPISLAVWSSTPYSSFCHAPAGDAVAFIRTAGRCARDASRRMRRRSSCPRSCR